MWYIEFVQMCNDYQALLNLWDNMTINNKKVLDSATKAIITGAKAKMKSFYFSFI